MHDKPLIVQSDRTMLLDVHSPAADECRDAIVSFSELVKSPEHLHTFAISNITIWNACSAGVSPDFIMESLEKYSRFEVPEVVKYFIEDNCSRFGAICFEEYDDDRFLLTCSKDIYRTQLLSIKSLLPYLEDRLDDDFIIPMAKRGELKLKLIYSNFPVNDLIPLKKGLPLDITLREETLSGRKFALRNYQKDSIRAFYADGARGAGYGTIVLPCGSGKTIVGLGAMAALKTSTLILAPNVAAVHQWIREILDKTTLSQDYVGEYGCGVKEIKPVTVCTYSMLINHSNEEQEMRNFRNIASHSWGLVIYDEVHVLPAPVFQLSASLQAVYRLGLTATLIREDGKERDVFSLVGPKRYDVPWSELEKKGFIATAYCHELRVPLPRDMELEYAAAPGSEKIKIAAKNPAKIDVVRRLLEEHEGRQILIIGQYLDQLREIQKTFSFPMITGAMNNLRRDELYQEFRDGKIHVLIVSKVANYAIDLPDASVAIQVSGTFGSRQEEAQRLGRILRPKNIDSHFYTLVTKYSKEEDFSLNRQKFLCEQGYSYIVENA